MCNTFDRNKLDGRFYAVKKIIIKQGQRLTRMMREVIYSEKSLLNPLLLLGSNIKSIASPEHHSILSSLARRSSRF